jgi:ribokinase
VSVTVFGSINMDVVLRVAHLPVPGETLAARSIDYLPGGKGANQAVASARYGAATRMIGAIGDDAHGTTLRDFLNGTGVDVGQIVQVAGPTGTAFVSVADSGENQIVIVAGANAQAETASPGSEGVALAQLELPLEAVTAFMAAARRAGLFTMLNAAPAVAGAEAMFPDVDLLVVNETELGFYIGRTLPDDPAEIATAARDLLSRDGQHIVVTLGAEGALCVGADRVLAIPAQKVAAVVDTTGAGDCFCGVLAACLSECVTLEEALQVATKAAAISVQRAGAAASMPTRAEILV